MNWFKVERRVRALRHLDLKYCKSSPWESYGQAYFYFRKIQLPVSMSRKYKIRDQDKLYFVTFTVIQWLDVFSRRHYRDIFLDSLRYCQKNKGLEICAYCIMTSYIHLIIGKHGEAAMEGIIRDIKKYTSIKIIEAIRDNPEESRKEFLLWHFERAGTHK